MEEPKPERTLSDAEGEATVPDSVESSEPTRVSEETLAQTMADVSESAVSSDPEPATDKVEQERIRYFGDYELLEEIARGGMGVVYKAQQTRLRRIVAVKMILRGQLASEKEVRRFLVEAEAAANLDHPGIVPVYEFGEHSDTHFFSMAFVDGPSLAEKVGEQPLPTDEATELMIQIADAVAYAHRHGVIHRDLKPANVLIDRDGQPRITDFGLAKRIDADDELTQDGSIMGSVYYMPPEQATGSKKLIGPAADIYSLGAILYKLITGHPPFQAPTTIGILKQVMEQEPVPPRRADPRIPIDLETLCLKCLQKDISRRFESADEFAEELRRFQRGEPIRSRPISRGAHVWRWCLRNPLPAGLAVGLIAVLLIGVATATSFFHRAEAEHRRNLQQQQTVEMLSQMVLSKTLDQTKDWLNLFFEPVERELLLMREWTHDGVVDAERPHQTNRHFIPFITLYPQVSSLMIADDRGREHMLLSLEQTGTEEFQSDWLFRRTRKDEWGEEVEVYQWSGDLYEQAKVTRKELEYDPRETVWFKGAISKRPSSEQAVDVAKTIHWTEPYVFFVTKDLGITASASLNRPESPDVNTIVALDILLMDITRYTMAAKPTPNGKVLVLDKDGKLVGLPQASHLPTREEWANYYLKSISQSGVPAVIDAAATFQFSADGEPQIHAFSSEGETWWGAAEQLKLSDDLVLWMLVLIPEADLHAQFQER